jgi:hypothetical protein
VKRYAQRRVIAVKRRLIAGTPARVAALRRRSQGNGVINTASIERLNATFRERLAALTRRGRALEHGMYLMGTVYTFCTPQARLRLATPTAGMAAGITDHCWTVRERLSFHGPPPRWAPPTQCGRRSRALQRLIERWCGDHG